MNSISALYPDVVVGSVAELDVSFLKKHNIKGVIFDIDNTLVRHTTITPPKNIQKYLENLRKSGIKIAIVSNNKKERVVNFCCMLGIPYSYRAYKPFKKSLINMQNKLQLKQNEICLVGDQIFTDIYGANRMGFMSVLVTQLGENETGFVAFKRVFEKMVMKRYNDIEKNKHHNI